MTILVPARSKSSLLNVAKKGTVEGGGFYRMKVLRSRFLSLLVIFAAACAFASVASASNIDFTIHWDPTTPTTLGPLYEITSPTAFYSVSWQACSNYSTAFNPAPTGDACLGFYNDTGTTLTQFNIAFTVPTGSPMIGQTIGCTPDDGYISSQDCGSAGSLYAGENVDLTFFGGTPVGLNQGFWFSETGACGTGNGSCLPEATVSAAAEPGTLALSGIALLGLAAFGLRRIRASS
jgi:hypothetical protein